MTARFFVYGFNSSDHEVQRVARVVGELGIDVCAWATRPQMEAAIHRALPSVPFFPVPLAESAAGSAYAKPVEPPFELVDEEILRNLLDRERDFQNHLDSSQLRLEIGCYVSDILDATRPDCVVFSDVPHDAFSYTLFKTAKRRGIRTLFIKKGPAPHLVLFGEEIHDAVPHALRLGNEALEGDEAPELSEQTTAFLRRFDRDYETAKPEYMRRHEKSGRLQAKIKKALGTPAEAFNSTGVRKLAAYARRQQLLRHYESLTTPVRRDRPFVPVFLHLQPERTTVPEGSWFGQQWLMVQCIANAIPDDWSVCVREHPSTFRSGPKLVRGSWFYEGLLRIPKVSLASVEDDVFDLVDASQFVATVTGNVALESVMRGKKALIFGAAAFEGCPGTYRVREPGEAAAVVESLLAAPEPRTEDVRSFYARLERSPRVWQSPIDANSNIHQYWTTGEVQENMLRLMIQEHLSTPGPTRP